jgi:putative nucleotidyltransferase with HDIG domain
MCVVWGLSPLYVPVPLMVMVMCLVYDKRFGIGVAVFYALLVHLACPGADAESFTLLVGGVMTALYTDQIRTRSALVVTGLFAGATQFCTVWGLGLVSALDGSPVPLRFWESVLMPESIAALVNGVASGFIVTGLLPAIEIVFGITTDIRLLEWSDPNQPLLQRLLLDAPGSYHHSMVVGSLAADAAETVGANPLLARVSAYFHDIGKLKKPQYFAENVPSGAQNPHDELSPTMSSLIITAHPKDGADMAEEYGVPRVVRDVILQSHGSTLVKYFWRRAQEKATERDQPDERSFRYRLPKPRGKEAAIVMICDAVESAARSLENPSVGQLRNLVQDLVMDRLHDGQFDESQLTITDLKRLEDCLVRGLTAVFHSRVAYPGQEKRERGPGRAAEGGNGNGRPPRAEPAAVAAAPQDQARGADGD